MTSVTLDLSKLPKWEAVNTSHWPGDQQIQFAKAVQGIRSAQWFQAVVHGVAEFDQERIACCFAFAAFANLRRSVPEIRPDRESLMKDLPGLMCSA